MPSRPGRPDIDPAALLALPRSGSEVLAEVLALVIALGGVAYSFSAWSTLPAQVPTHFDLSGRVDGYGSKDAFLFLPLISVVLWATLTVVVRFPRLFNYPFRLKTEELPGQFRLARWFLSWLKVAIALIFALTQMTIVQMAVQPEGGGRWMAALLVLVVAGQVGILILVVAYLSRSAGLRKRAAKEPATSGFS
ncbi:MAG: DUF1648 domain-containing protein [Gaiellales bacterium]|nr:DUF1648 domain-containing protein [Gaiellales bacterium]